MSVENRCNLTLWALVPWLRPVAIEGYTNDAAVLGLNLGMEELGRVRVRDNKRVRDDPRLGVRDMSPGVNHCEHFNTYGAKTPRAWPWTDTTNGSLNVSQCLTRSPHASKHTRAYRTKSSTARSLFSQPP